MLRGEGHRVPKTSCYKVVHTPKVSSTTEYSLVFSNHQQYQISSSLLNMHNLKHAVMIALVFPVLMVAILQQWIFTFDLVLRIILAEQNSYLNKSRRLRRGFAHAIGKDKLTPIIASVIGHREDHLVFERCLSSYKSQFQAGILVVGVDGLDNEDADMVRVHEKVN